MRNRPAKIVIILGLCILTSIVAAHSTGKVVISDRKLNLAQCDNKKEFQPIKRQIWAMEGDVSKIVKYMLDGEGTNSTWNELAFFCDTYGPRMSGSKALETAIDYLENKMKSSGLKVHAEEATVPHWEVLRQSCAITAPVPHTMSILTLGSSVSTNGTLEAEAFVVHDWNELETKGAEGQLRNRIVVFNYHYKSYPAGVKYRKEGALRAAKYGAAAALIRSVTPFSINSPHAGTGSRSIPTAAITVEDANLIERWVKRGETVKLAINLETRHHQDAKSRNLVGDIRGTSKPDEIVFVSGHMDSWYNTAGAMDDGGGMMISYMALDVLSKLQLRAKRTMRAILWTAEEPGLIGAQQYFEKHKDKLENFKVVIESDAGTFDPLGLAYANMGEMGQCVLQELLFVIGNRVSNLEVTKRYEASDIGYFTNAGVPGLSLFNENSRYFWFHHTAGDTMDVEDPSALDKGTALFASTVYVLSNLDVDMKT